MPVGQSTVSTVEAFNQTQTPEALKAAADIENARTEPTFESYARRRNYPDFLLDRVNRAHIIYTQIIEDRDALIASQTNAATSKRSDPLGIFKTQTVALPGGYGLSDIGAADESGFSTVCRAEGGYNGKCASCMCRTSTTKIADGIVSVIYDKDSFIQSCIQGEVWGSIEESLISVVDDSSQDTLSKNTLKSNIFLGSLTYARATFITATACMYHHEWVGVPTGSQWLRVGVASSFLGMHQVASYFEDGDRKYCNFFIQKHHAGRTYQVSSPTVELQGSSQDGILSLSTSARSSNVAAAAAIFGGLMSFLLPPLWQKTKTYVHHHRRAELKLVKSTIHMRGGDFVEEKYLTKLKEKKQSISDIQSGKSWWNPLNLLKRPWWSLARTEQKLDKKILKNLELTEKMHPEFVMVGEPNANLIHMKIDSKQPWGGPQLLLNEDHLIFGGAEGPDIVIDNKDHKIRVYSLTKPFSAGEKMNLYTMELDQEEITIRSLKDIPKSPRALEIDSEIIVNAKGITLRYCGDSTPVEIHLAAAGVTIESSGNIDLDATQVEIKGEGEVSLKGKKVKVNAVECA